MFFFFSETVYLLLVLTSCLLMTWLVVDVNETLSGPFATETKLLWESTTIEMQVILHSPVFRDWQI